MARAVTLQELEDNIRYQADVQGITARHDRDNMVRMINASVRAMRQWVSIEGSSHYLVPATGTTGAGATSPYHWRELDLSAVSPAVVRVHGIDVDDGNGAWRSLLNVDFSERNTYGTRASTLQAFANYQTAKVALLPAPASSLTYIAWYLPVFTELSDPDDEFTVVETEDQWVVWDVFVKLINRDTYPQAYQMAVAERETMRANIAAASKIVSAGAAQVRRDSYAERRMATSRRREYPPP